MMRRTFPLNVNNSVRQNQDCIHVVYKACDMNAGYYISKYVRFMEVKLDVTYKDHGLDSKYALTKFVQWGIRCLTCKF